MINSLQTNVFIPQDFLFTVLQLIVILQNSNGAQLLDKTDLVFIKFNFMYIGETSKCRVTNIITPFTLNNHDRKLFKIIYGFLYLKKESIFYAIA